MSSAIRGFERNIVVTRQYIGKQLRQFFFLQPSRCVRTINLTLTFILLWPSNDHDLDKCISSKLQYWQNLGCQAFGIFEFWYYLEDYSFCFFQANQRKLKDLPARKMDTRETMLHEIREKTVKLKHVEMGKVVGKSCSKYVFLWWSNACTWREVDQCARCRLNESESVTLFYLTDSDWMPWHTYFITRQLT